MALIATDSQRIIIGLGQTGLSCARFLAAKGWPFAVVDTRAEPPLADLFRREFPEVELRCGPLQADFLSRARSLILSPGVARAEPAIQAAESAGAQVLGDIDLFCAEVTAPIVAITGSNAKSTVTTLVGEMAKAAGIRVGVGGNIGVPVLDLLQTGPADLYVLELSSFQLETTHLLRAKAATVLNISPDHLDRYDSIQAYYLAKHRIYRGCEQAIFNRDDALTQPLIAVGMRAQSFGLQTPDLGQWGVREEAGVLYLAKGLETLMPATELRIQGQHNLANALAALALGEAVKLPRQAMLEALRQFSGLPHRCQWVAAAEGVTWINDSKGTNVGATLAAIQGLGSELTEQGRLLVILGGVAKDQRFVELRTPLQTFARAVILLGQDAPIIAEDLAGLPLYFVDSMQAAVAQAQALAEAGDVVLLSPACASFDMFSGYAQRGEVFAASVEARLKEAACSQN